MSIGHKSSNTQVFRLMVYRRALHPELFDLQGRRIHRQEEYEIESWVIPAGHVLRFQREDLCVTETVIENGDHLPEHGLVYALPCLGEKDYELELETRVGYITTVQTELLTDNLYHTTLRELKDTAEEVNAMLYEWTDGDGAPCLSMLDMQRFKREFHVQSYHLMGASGLVLRTQSIFEVR
jgi:Protein of unknown function DUF2617